MIITISGANFSASNIGTLSTWTVSKSIGAGAEHSIPSYVDKNSAFNYTITLKDGYTFGTYSVTMGGQTITPTVTETSMTINIASVTGAIRIEVKTINSSTGEEDKPVTPDPEEPGTGGGSTPTIYRTNKALGIQILEFGDFKFQSNSTTQGASYHCQVVAADVSNYVGKTITISTTHAYIKGNSTYGDAYYCFFLNAAPNNKTPEMLPSITKLSDLGATSGNGGMDVVLNKNIIVQKFDVVSTTDKYSTKSVTVPEGAKYIYFTHTRKGGADKEANIAFN
jgi:hypothetical protein